MRIGVLTVQVPFIRGGAEMHAENLCTALRAEGHEAEILSLPFKWFPPDRIAPQILASRLCDVSASSGTPIDRVIGLKFPAYLMPHPNKVLWILHQHRSAYDLWETPFGDLHGQAGGEAARIAIREADRRFIPEARHVFTNSRRVSARLRDALSIDAMPLYHPPPLAERFRCGPSGDFLLLPSRINPMKRQDLVIQALALARSEVGLRIVGPVDSPDYMERLRSLAAALPAGRVIFEGAVSDERKIELYSQCRAVVYVPFDEDYGYVTLEAMLSGKPVVTCSDSGGTLEFVEDGRTGGICEPDPISLAAGIDRVCDGAARAEVWGAAGRERFATLGVSWKRVVACLTE